MEGLVVKVLIVSASVLRRTRTSVHSNPSRIVLSWRREDKHSTETTKEKKDHGAHGGVEHREAL